MNENFNIETLSITEQIKTNYEDIIHLLGEDKLREGLLKTPERASKAMKFLTEGYEKDPSQILQSAMFEEDYNEMVIVKDIELYSLCEHHLLPIVGRAHVAYISKGKVIGLSKMNRIVDHFAKRPQVQERLTHQILNCIQDTLKPQGAAVVIEAQHTCMMMRGVEKQNSSMHSSVMLGSFRESQATRNEFLSLIK